MTVELTAENLERWIADIDPVIRRLAVLAHGVEDARIQLNGDDSAPNYVSFIDRIHGEVREELASVLAAFDDAESRLKTGKTLSDIARALAEGGE